MVEQTPERMKGYRTNEGMDKKRCSISGNDRSLVVEEACKDDVVQMELCGDGVKTMVCRWQWYFLSR